MKTPVCLIALAFIFCIGLPLTAQAGWRGHEYYGSHNNCYGDYGYRRSGYRVSSVYVSAPVYPVVVERPVYYSRPVYQGREVVVASRGNSMEVNVQIALRKKGYYSGPIDGDIGPGTRAAIRAYQSDHNLRPTGYIGNSLLERLGL